MGKIFIALSFFLLFSMPYTHALEPAFKVFATPDKAEYNPEENVTINILIDGKGGLHEAYLYVYVPQFLITKETFFITQYLLVCNKTNLTFNKNNGLYTPDLNNQCCSPSLKLDTIKIYNSATSILNKDFFGYECNNNNDILSDDLDSLDNSDDCDNNEENR